MPSVPYWNAKIPATSRSGGKTQQINGVITLSILDISGRESIADRARDGVPESQPCRPADVQEAIDRLVQGDPKPGYEPLHDEWTDDRQVFLTPAKSKTCSDCSGGGNTPGSTSLKIAQPAAVPVRSRRNDYTCDNRRVTHSPMGFRRFPVDGSGSCHRSRVDMSARSVYSDILVDRHYYGRISDGKEESARCQNPGHRGLPRQTPQRNGE